MDVSKAGILFPGQGAQNVGMGNWLREYYDVARQRFDTAGEILGYDLAELCANGPKEKLDQTEFSQPALFVVGMAAADVLAEHHPERLNSVVAAAGLSLGEYTAVCFSGGLDFENSLRLVHRRGKAMQEAADAVDSGMASVLGMDLDEVRRLCDEHKGDEILQPANLLCAGNVAVSGHTVALDRLSASDAKMVRLSVAGAFHTPLMQPAVESLKAALAEMPIQDTRIPVYSNVDAKPHQSGDEIRDLLARQVVRPVLWEKSIEQMVDDGVEGFLEVGTGKVLRGIMKRIKKFGRKGPTDGFGDEGDAA